MYAFHDPLFKIHNFLPPATLVPAPRPTRTHMTQTRTRTPPPRPFFSLSRVPCRCETWPRAGLGTPRLPRLTIRGPTRHRPWPCMHIHTTLNPPWSLPAHATANSRFPRISRPHLQTRARPRSCGGEGRGECQFRRAGLRESHKPLLAPAALPRALPRDPLCYHPRVTFPRRFEGHCAASPVLHMLHEPIKRLLSTGPIQKFAR